MNVDPNGEFVQVLYYVVVISLTAYKIYKTAKKAKKAAKALSKSKSKKKTFKPLKLNLQYFAMPMSNKRFLNNYSVKNYKNISLDLERGGSQLENIHVVVNNVKYIYQPHLDDFVSKNGFPIPSKLRYDTKIRKALVKAFKYKGTQY